MNKIFLLLIFTTPFFVTCKGGKVIEPLQRDTTITPQNAFTSIYVDSLAVAKFIDQHSLDHNKATQLTNFYKSRNYQYAWFTEDGLAEHTKAFWNLHNTVLNLSKDSSFIDKALHEQMNAIVESDSARVTKSNMTAIELQLTQHFFEYAHYAYAGKIDPKDLQWHIPRKKVNAVQLLDSLIASKGRNLETWEPVNAGYRSLKKSLLQFYDIEKKGGWKQVSLNKKNLYKTGDTALAIRHIKERLRLGGDFNSTDTSTLFTKELAAAVQQVETRFGYKADGVVDATLVKALNVSVKARIQQLLINMERMRWMPQQPDSTRVFINIPAFTLLIFEGGKKVADMKIVVGKAANQTVVFTNALKYVVFSPYWNVPESIVRNEILPAIRRNPGYLGRNNMEQTGTANGLPVIRQRPGANNALGRVKFIFPNSYNIYLHDTPSKSLFNRESRAFSHGCMRISEPKKFATFLLKNQKEWTSEKIDQAMHSGKEQWVPLLKPVPVIVSYFTAWVNNEGLLNFREDIYGHDKKMAERLFVQSSVASK